MARAAPGNHPTRCLHGVIPDCDAPVHLVSFDAVSFNSDAFAELGIPCPPAIARSVRKRQAEFLHGRLAARAALTLAGAASTTVGIGASREPLWPGGFIGSITHRRDLAAAVALPRGPLCGVGIDIEKIVAADMRAALVPAVISAEEFAYLSSLAGTLSIEALMTIVFSAKESLFKAGFASVGRYFDFAAARVEHVDIDAGELMLELTESLSVELPARAVLRLRFCWPDAETVLTSCGLKAVS